MVTRFALSFAALSLLLPACGGGKGGDNSGTADDAGAPGSDAAPPGTMPNPDGGAPIPDDADPPPTDGGDGASAGSQTLWDKFLGDGAYEDVGGVATDATGNVYYTGYFQGTINFGGPAPLTAAGQSSDIFIAKYDASGNYVWAFRFGDNEVQAASGIAVDAQGNVVITGINEGVLDFGTATTKVTSGGLEDVFVAKFDPTGAPLWAKDYGDGQSQLGYSVAVDATGNVGLVGAYEGTINFGAPTTALTSAGGDDIYVVKLDPTGNALWAKSFGDTADQYGTFGTFDATGDLVVTADFAGTITVVTGMPLASAGMKDILLAKFDPTGNALFAERWGDAQDQTGDCVAIDAAGEIVLSGGFEGSLTIGTEPAMVAMDEGAKYLAKFDSTGKPLWVKSFGDGSVYDWTAVALDKTGGAFMVGEFIDSISFGSTTLTASDKYDIFVAGFDTNGTPLWADRYGAVDNQFARSVAVAPTTGDLAVGGYFLGKMGFTAGGGQSATGNGLLYLVQFSP
jgi:hypothetical protein